MALNEIIIKCEFADKLKDNFCEQTVRELSDEVLKKKVLKKRGIKWNNINMWMFHFESVAKHLSTEKKLRPCSAGVLKIQRQRNLIGKKYISCGFTDHWV